MTYNFSHIDVNNFAASLGHLGEEERYNFLANQNTIVSASPWYQGRSSSFARAWINGGDGKVDLGKEGLLILYDPDSGTNDELDWTDEYSKTYFIKDTNHILLTREGGKFPYALIYNGLEPGGIDIGPKSATSNSDLELKFSQLLLSNRLSGDFESLKERYTIETIEWDSLNSIMDVTKTSISHITLDVIRELSYLLRRSGLGFNEGIILDAKWLTRSAFGFDDSDWDKATFTWYKDESVIASGKEYRSIDTSIYGAGNYKLDIEFSPKVGSLAAIIGTTISIGTLASDTGPGSFVSGFISNDAGVNEWYEGVAVLVAPDEVVNDPDGDHKSPEYKYQWLLDNQEISGATNKTYSVPLGEAGFYDVKITYLDAAGNEATVRTDMKAKDGNKVAFIDHGPGILGEISSSIPNSFVERVTLSSGEITDDPDGDAVNPDYSYQWYLDNVQIPDATNSAYDTSGTGSGSYKVGVDYTDKEGHIRRIFSSTQTVSNINDGIAAFEIEGNQLVGQTLRVIKNTADPDGTRENEELYYSWQSSSDNTNWTSIQSGGESTYTVTFEEGGKKIRAVVSYTDNQEFDETVTADAVEIEVPTRTYGLTTSKSSQEGNGLTTTVKTTNVPTGTTLYWKFGGNNIDLSDFDVGLLSGSGTVGSSGSFTFQHVVAKDDSIEGNETIEIKLFSDSTYVNQMASANHTIIELNKQKLADVTEDITGVKRIVPRLTKGQNYSLSRVCDYDGNLHAGSNNSETASAYKYQHSLDINGDGTKEAIFTNKVSGRWVSASIDPITGIADFSDYGQGGSTRVVGIYDDPLIAEGNANGGFLSDGVTPAPANFGVSDSERYVTVNGSQVDRLALNSQVRFQNDLNNDNLDAKVSGDYDSDGITEVYWKTVDGTAYLRALMHADGNIRYANYQSEQQMTDYLTGNGYGSAVSDIV